MTIQDFVDELCRWQEGGYISANVWQEVWEYVPQNLLPVAGASATPSSGTDKPPSGSGNQTRVNKGMISWSQLSVGVSPLIPHEVRKAPSKVSTAHCSVHAKVKTICLQGHCL